MAAAGSSRLFELVLMAYEGYSKTALKVQGSVSYFHTLLYAERPRMSIWELEQPETVLMDVGWSTDAARRGHRVELQPESSLCGVHHSSIHPATIIAAISTPTC